MEKKQTLMLDHIDRPQSLIVIEEKSEVIYIGPEGTATSNGESAKPDGIKSEISAVDDGDINVPAPK